MEKYDVTLSVQLMASGGKWMVMVSEEVTPATILGARVCEYAEVPDLPDATVLAADVYRDLQKLVGQSPAPDNQHSLLLAVLWACLRLGRTVRWVNLDVSRLNGFYRNENDLLVTAVQTRNRRLIEGAIHAQWVKEQLDDASDMCRIGEMIDALPEQEAKDVLRAYVYGRGR